MRRKSGKEERKINSYSTTNNIAYNRSYLARDGIPIEVGFKLRPER
jgi:hypothetical protein